MKKLVVVVLVFVTTHLFAQTEKGDFLVGGSIGFQTTSGNSNITFAPNVGYFVKNNFAVGANVNLSSVKQDIQKITEFDLGPFARYYVGHNNLRPFASLSLLYKTNTVKDTDDGTKSSVNGFGYTLGVGAAAFFSPDVAFEGFFGYNFSQFETAESNRGVSLNLGFQVYINSRKMSRMKQLRLPD